MTTSLIRYFDQTEREGQRLHWHRAGLDGLPYRGPSPQMTEEEYETRVVTVRDFRNAFFDVKNPDQNRDYQRIMECCANGWFQLVFLERFYQGSSVFYVEWLEFYREDGTRTPYAALTNGAD